MTKALERDDVMDRVLAHARREFPNFQFDRVGDQWRVVNGAIVLHAESVAALCARLREKHSPLLLTDDQARALALYLGRAFPPWRIWWTVENWYATNPCRISACFCTPTLHAPDPCGLCQQLDAVEQAGRARAWML
ncbi:hypothetical protein [Streptosporangium sp. NBC_01469]|uniref:hypothetical protein n=1 Tax=Streptosporangium sp. NBC_01469 TaxID=2903898 RepID=UPI002E2AA77C|nr:hypothetical protein [Streptosporangium sp. NBC_01469]